jgi:hypothetical protein
MSFFGGSKKEIDYPFTENLIFLRLSLLLWEAGKTNFYQLLSSYDYNIRPKFKMSSKKIKNQKRFHI